MKLPSEQHLKELEGDKFGYKVVAKTVLDEILLQMELPSTFGFYGNWGSGKSTIIEFIRQYLKNEPGKYKNITSVYFEAWKYEYSEQTDLLFALLNSIKYQTASEDKKWKKLLTSIAVISSGVLRETGLVNTDHVVKDYEKFESKIYKGHEIWIDKIEGLKNDFDEIVKSVLKKNKSTKLFIFVDDLDRCLPENAVKLLESIKNFLSVDNVLFVLAIDRRVVTEMIENKYGLHFGYGDEYLMKIIHYYYELPTVSLRMITEGVFRTYGIEFSERELAYVVNFLESQAREPRLAKHILHQLGMNLALSKQIREYISEHKDEKTFKYTFVASFLLTRFSKLFSNGNPLDLLTNVRDSAGIIIANRNREDEYRKSAEYFPIDPEIRNKLEAIITQHPINSGNESQPDRLINDMSKLSTIIKKLRSHY